MPSIIKTVSNYSCSVVFLPPSGFGGQLTIVSQSKLLGSHGWAVSEVQPSSVDTDVLVLLRLTMGYWGIRETERPRIWRAWPSGNFHTVKGLSIKYVCNMSWLHSKWEKRPIVYLYIRFQGQYKPGGLLIEDICLCLFLFFSCFLHLALAVCGLIGYARLSRW